MRGFPSSFYRDAGIGDISVDPFSDEESDGARR